MQRRAGGIRERWWLPAANIDTARCALAAVYNGEQLWIADFSALDHRVGLLVRFHGPAATDCTGISQVKLENRLEIIRWLGVLRQEERFGWPGGLDIVHKARVPLEGQLRPHLCLV
jgi:hypothetical protein